MLFSGAEADVAASGASLQVREGAGCWQDPYCDARLPAGIPEDFQLGLVLAPTGGGKTAALTALCRQRGLRWQSDLCADVEQELPNAAVVSNPHLGSAEEAVSRLAAAGLGSVPAWCRPFRVLSQGEQSRVRCALSVRDGVLLDDFGAFVAAKQARGMAAGVARLVRKEQLRNVVVASVHAEIAEWMCPDWVWRPHLSSGASEPCVVLRPQLQRRPRVDFEFVGGEGAADEDSVGAAAATASELQSVATRCEFTLVRCHVDSSPALQLVERLFDYRVPKFQTVQLPCLPPRLLERSAAFRIGVLQGPSGTGKTTALRGFAATDGAVSGGSSDQLSWVVGAEGPSAAVVVSPSAPALGAAVLDALGLPGGESAARHRPLGVLSSGQRHLCSVAAALLRAPSGGVAVIDEFGSRLDSDARAHLCRGVTQLLGGEHQCTSGTPVQVPAKKLVVATVHAEVPKLLQADWWLDMAAGLLWEKDTMQPVSATGVGSPQVTDRGRDGIHQREHVVATAFGWGGAHGVDDGARGHAGVDCENVSQPIQRRVVLEVRQLSAAAAAHAWRRFSRHHYLSSELSTAATCFEAHWGDEA